MTAKGGEVTFRVEGGTVFLFSIEVESDFNLCFASASLRVLYEEVMIMAGGFEQVHDGPWSGKVSASFQSASKARGTYDEVSSYTDPDSGMMCRVTTKETWSATKE